MHNASAQESRAEQIGIQKQSFWWSVCAAVFATSIALLGTTESLWVDELHSSWTISGSWSEIAERARWGNQSPLYFWGLRQIDGLLQGTVSQELALRLPSVLGWGATVGLLVYHVLCRAGAARNSVWGAVGVVGLVTVWLSFDRIQLFYATEARVYACLQLISFVNWLLVASLVSGRGGRGAGSVAAGIAGMRALGKNPRAPALTQKIQIEMTAGWRVLAWSALSLLLVYLHLTAALAVAWQWLFAIGAVLILKRADRWQQIGWWFAAGGGVSLLSLPAWLWSQSVWERREQWRGFAGDTSLTNALALFPLMEFLVPLVVAVVLDRCWRDRAALTLTTGDKNCNKNIWLALWVVAVVGPWLCAWFATWLEVAPLMHRRFVIVSALPLVALAIELWQTLRRPVLRLLSGAGVVAWLVIGQGTVDAWQQGNVIGWQRVEGWREAMVWIDRRIAPEDEVWCASGLIEGSRIALPVGEETNRYLSFPLRGCYRMRAVDEANRRAPQALVNEPERWKTQWQARSRLSETKLPVGRAWIVFRGTAEQLSRSLQQARIRDAQIQIAPVSFGRVAVAVVKGELGWVGEERGQSFKNFSM